MWSTNYKDKKKLSVENVKGIKHNNWLHIRITITV